MYHTGIHYAEEYYAGYEKTLSATKWWARTLVRTEKLNRSCKCTKHHRLHRKLDSIFRELLKSSFFHWQVFCQRYRTHRYLAYHEFHENCHSVTFYFMKKDSKQWCDTTTPESIHTKDESKRGSAFAFIFGVNWPLKWMWRNNKFHGIHVMSTKDLQTITLGTLPLCVASYTL